MPLGPAGAPGGTRESILWIDMVGESLDRY